MPVTARTVELVVSMADIQSAPDLRVLLTERLRDRGVPFDCRGDIAYGGLMWHTLLDGAGVRFLWQAVEYHFDPATRH